eukprot:NODE_692_length_4692_cov_0.413238.p5 type:complete len:119 gc:universal NODE_692_length_4692_cov_0.413238:1748-2104(+)
MASSLLNATIPDYFHIYQYRHGHGERIPLKLFSMRFKDESPHIDRIESKKWTFMYSNEAHLSLEQVRQKIEKHIDMKRGVMLFGGRCDTFQFSADSGDNTKVIFMNLVLAEIGGCMNT